MDLHTLEKAVRLKKQISLTTTKTNRAYNPHVYLAVSLGDMDVSKEIDKEAIGKILHDHYAKKTIELQHELDAL